MQSESAICKIKSKQMKTTERHYKISKENAALTENLKKSVDHYNELKSQLVSLEQDSCYVARALQASKALIQKLTEESQCKKNELENIQESQKMVEKDLTNINEQISALRCNNKTNQEKIDKNLKLICTWTARQVKNTEALADVMNSKNKCSICGNNVLVQ